MVSFIPPTFTHPCSVLFRFFSLYINTSILDWSVFFMLVYPPVSYFYFIWHTRMPCDPWISVSRGLFTSMPGGGDRNICVFLLCAHESKRQKGGQHSAISGEWEMTEPVIQFFPPLRSWAGFSMQLLCDMCGIDLISLGLCCLAVSNHLPSITNHSDVTSHLFVHPFSQSGPGL